MLPEQKLNQVNVGYVIDAAKELINLSTRYQMLAVISILQQNSSEAICLSDLLIVGNDMQTHRT